MLVWDKSKITIWERKSFKNALKILGKSLPTEKSIFNSINNGFFRKATKYPPNFIVFAIADFWERLKTIIWEQLIFKNIASTLRKRSFSNVTVKFFFFIPQNTRILTFLLMLVLKRSGVTVWERNVS